MSVLSGLFNAKTKWVMKATSSSSKPAKAKDINAIIEEIQKSPHSASWVIDRIQNRPLLSNPIIAFKTVHLIQLLIFRGPAEAVRLSGMKSILDKIVNGFEGGGFEQYVCEFSRVTYMGVATHQRWHMFLLGDWSIASVVFWGEAGLKGRIRRGESVPCEETMLQIHTRSSEPPQLSGGFERAGSLRTNSVDPNRVMPNREVLTSSLSSSFALANNSSFGNNFFGSVDQIDDDKSDTSSECSEGDPSKRGDMHFLTTFPPSKQGHNLCAQPFPELLARGSFHNLQHTIITPTVLKSLVRYAHPLVVLTHKMLKANFNPLFNLFIWVSKENLREIGNLFVLIMHFYVCLIVRATVGSQNAPNEQRVMPQKGHNNSGADNHSTKELLQFLIENNSEELVLTSINRVVGEMRGRRSLAGKGLESKPRMNNVRSYSQKLVQQLEAAVRFSSLNRDSSATTEQRSLAVELLHLGSDLHQFLKKYEDLREFLASKFPLMQKNPPPFLQENLFMDILSFLHLITQSAPPGVSLKGDTAMDFNSQNGPTLNPSQILNHMGKLDTENGSNRLDTESIQKIDTKSTPDGPYTMSEGLVRHNKLENENSQYRDEKNLNSHTLQTNFSHDIQDPLLTPTPAGASCLPNIWPTFFNDKKIKSAGRETTKYPSRRSSSKTLDRSTLGSDLDDQKARGKIHRLAKYDDAPNDQLLKKPNCASITAENEQCNTTYVSPVKNRREGQNVDQMSKNMRKLDTKFAAKSNTIDNTPQTNSSTNRTPLDDRTTDVTEPSLDSPLDNPSRCPSEKQIQNSQKKCGKFTWKYEKNQEETIRKPNHNKQSIKYSQLDYRNGSSPKISRQKDVTQWGASVPTPSIRPAANLSQTYPGESDLFAQQPNPASPSGKYSVSKDTEENNGTKVDLKIDNKIASKNVEKYPLKYVPGITRSCPSVPASPHRRESQSAEQNYEEPMRKIGGDIIIVGQNTTETQQLNGTQYFEGPAPSAVHTLSGSFEGRASQATTIHHVTLRERGEKRGEENKYIADRRDSETDKKLPYLNTLNDKTNPQLLYNAHSFKIKPFQIRQIGDALQKSVGDIDVLKMEKKTNYAKNPQNYMLSKNTGKNGTEETHPMDPQNGTATQLMVNRLSDSPTDEGSSLQNSEDYSKKIEHSSKNTPKSNENEDRTQPQNMRPYGLRDATENNRIHRSPSDLNSRNDQINLQNNQINLQNIYNFRDNIHSISLTPQTLPFAMPYYAKPGPAAPPNAASSSCVAKDNSELTNNATFRAEISRGNSARPAQFGPGPQQDPSEKTNLKNPLQNPPTEITTQRSQNITHRIQSKAPHLPPSKIALEENLQGNGTYPLSRSGINPPFATSKMSPPGKNHLTRNPSVVSNFAKLSIASKSSPPFKNAKNYANPPTAPNPPSDPDNKAVPQNVLPASRKVSPGPISAQNIGARNMAHPILTPPFEASKRAGGPEVYAHFPGKSMPEKKENKAVGKVSRGCSNDGSTLNLSAFVNNNRNNISNKNTINPKNNNIDSMNNERNIGKGVYKAPALAERAAPYPKQGKVPPHANSPSNLERRFLEELEIDLKEIRLEAKIGSGATASVYRGIWRGTEIALKKLKNVENTYSKEFFRELGIMIRLRHPNLVLLMGATTKVCPLCVITEYCSGGTLFHLLHQRKFSLSWKQKLKIALDIAKGCLYLHSSNPQIIHRDLKSLNILLAEPLHTQNQLPLAKVSDFGLSKICRDLGLDYMTGMAGTYHWMAPEVLNNENYDERVDVYSFGIVLYEIVTGTLPYYTGKQVAPITIAINVAKGMRPCLKKLPSDCPPPLLALIQNCWAPQSTQRPPFTHILNVLKRLSQNS